MALGGIWILGGIGSLGDIALDPRAITGQVSNFSEAKVFLYLFTNLKLTILLYFQAQRHQCKACHLH